ncbi:hypothetical protein OG607_36720 [Streptomyces sp. NBC_01537]|uniref:hypothetical protein n=1 Tax=Streptomyces sp. NBC_01537 TaxID=2903896 RepID=UPI00386BA79E
MQREGAGWGTPTDRRPEAGAAVRSQRSAREDRTRKRGHVAPGDWGTGVGASLHAAYVRALCAAGLRHGTLYAWERNARARAFYARHGWRPDGRRRRGPGPGGANYIGLRLSLELRDAAQASSSSSAQGRATS